ncbi:unnamed protein product [Prorocentrum cordatum]|uniref:Uncharacterized protein n=1 Tax=Prorocentrum cordatum TaxID=2364126 RepID=A0ABN9SFC6_9DINO|nr:unnamed protein product [Polarella glacialis]
MRGRLRLIVGSGEVQGEKCTLESCLDDFPRYTPEFMIPYSTEQKQDAGCWGRLKSNGMRGTTVLRTIAEYESLAKCCYRQNVQDGPKEFRWSSGNELVKSWRPDKWLRGRRACDAQNGWHSANHLGLDGSTQSKCESLQ